MKSKVYFYKFKLVEALGGGLIVPQCIQSAAVSTSNEWYTGWSTYLVPETEDIKPITAEDMVALYKDNILAISCFNSNSDVIQAAVAREYEIKEAKRNLDATGWYCERFIETGKEIPEDIKAKRAEWRILANRD